MSAYHFFSDFAKKGFEAAAEDALHLREMARQERNADPLILAKTSDATRRLASVDSPQLPRQAKETIADPDELQDGTVAARNRYFAGEKKHRRGGGNPCHELPGFRADLRALADTYRIAPIRLSQAVALERRKLPAKAKRLLFCGAIGRRINCSASEEHKFHQPYMCHSRYCDVCGPAWFRQKFADSLRAFEPVVEHLLHEGRSRGREMVVAKLDIGNDPAQLTFPGVAMTVHEARDEDRVRCVDDLRPGWRLDVRPHSRNLLPVNQHVTFREVTGLGIHADDGTAF